MRKRFAVRRLVGALFVTAAFAGTTAAPASANDPGPISLPIVGWPTCC